MAIADGTFHLNLKYPWAMDGTNLFACVCVISTRNLLSNSHLPIDVQQIRCLRLGVFLALVPTNDHAQPEARGH